MILTMLFDKSEVDESGVDESGVDEETIERFMTESCSEEDMVDYFGVMLH